MWALHFAPCRDLDIRKFLDGIYVSERGLITKVEA
jgi:hypothetical protein